jgi:CheY-like chemotaxis protein
MSNSICVLLVDDDPDDCELFRTAISELPINVHLKIAYDGEHLLKRCPQVIKSTARLKKIPVIIFSTSVPDALEKKLFESEAKKYIRKPSTFQDLKSVILSILSDLSAS